MPQYKHVRALSLSHTPQLLYIAISHMYAAECSGVEVSSLAMRAELSNTHDAASCSHQVIALVSHVTCSKSRANVAFGWPPPNSACGFVSSLGQWVSGRVAVCRTCNDAYLIANSSV